MRTIVVAVFLLACAGSASAQALKLEFNQGKVSIDAAGVPVRTILAEWARLGGTKVVGAERIVGSPSDHPPRGRPRGPGAGDCPAQCRGLYGRAPTGCLSWRLGLRPHPGDADEHRPAGDRGSRATARPASSPRQRSGPRNGRGPFGCGANQNAAADFGAVPAADEPDAGVNEPAFQFPQQNPFQPGQPARRAARHRLRPADGVRHADAARRRSLPSSRSGSPEPGRQRQSDPRTAGADAAVSWHATPSGATGGFGVVGSPTPGVILQPPQPTQPGHRCALPGGD